MIVIGEKINGTRKKVGFAIAEKDVAFIQALATAQVDAGADYLDVNAGTAPDKEPGDLVWLIESVQAVTDVPLCLDSANPSALKAGFEVVDKKPIVNSLSGERDRIENILPLACKEQTELIVLALDDKGIPTSVQQRVDIISRLIGMTREGGLADEHLYIDPLITALSTDTDSGIRAFEAMRAIKSAFPKVHLTAGLSNISFGLPSRSIINQAFAMLAMDAGLDSAIIDPQDRHLQSILAAAEMTLGRDRFCSNFTRLFRQGKIIKPGG
jgi:5-methyltetrahydrofolate--homocysteine methyltransferase